MPLPPDVRKVVREFCLTHFQQRLAWKALRFVGELVKKIYEVGGFQFDGWYFIYTSPLRAGVIESPIPIYHDVVLKRSGYIVKDGSRFDVDVGVRLPVPKYFIEVPVDYNMWLDDVVVGAVSPFAPDWGKRLVEELENKLQEILKEVRMKRRVV